jgi:hypothetical protein
MKQEIILKILRILCFLEILYVLKKITDIQVAASVWADHL